MVRSNVDDMRLAVLKIAISILDKTIAKAQTNMATLNVLPNLRGAMNKACFFVLFQS